MTYKKIILLAIAVFGLLIFFKAEPYQNWIDRFILNPNTVLSEQFTKKTYEERKEYRFGNLYMLVDYIKKNLDTTSFKTKEPLILLPPNDYLKSVGVDAFSLPEPSIFYYHSGVKAVWTTSPNVEQANWVIIPAGANNVAFIPIRSKEELHQHLQTFSNFKPTL